MRSSVKRNHEIYGRGLKPLLLCIYALMFISINDLYLFTAQLISFQFIQGRGAWPINASPASHRIWSNRMIWQAVALMSREHV